jgi:hypothetical protein
MINKNDESQEPKTVTRTNSRFKVWYLTAFCGRTVRSVRRTPMMTLLGIMIYSKSWILVAY